MKGSSRAIVLGAGGSFGWIFHLALLSAYDELGDQAISQAHRLLGTSAGAAVAAGVLSGRDTNTLLETALKQPSHAAARLAVAMGTRRTLMSRLTPRRLKPLSLNMVSAAKEIGLGATTGLLAPGTIPTIGVRRWAQGYERDDWPDQLWITAVRIDDGSLEVFGRKGNPPSIADAIEASGSVPGVFRPKRIGEVRYVDGAVRSATNSDLLLDEGHETILISSPMTRPQRGPVRARARRQLRREVTLLRQRGIEVLVIEPDEAVNEAASLTSSDPKRAGYEIFRRSRDLAARRLQTRYLSS